MVGYQNCGQSGCTTFFRGLELEYPLPTIMLRKHVAGFCYSAPKPRFSIITQRKKRLKKTLLKNKLLSRPLQLLSQAIQTKNEAVRPGVTYGKFNRSLTFQKSSVLLNFLQFGFYRYVISNVKGWKFLNKLLMMNSWQNWRLGNDVKYCAPFQHSPNWPE